MPNTPPPPPPFTILIDTREQSPYQFGAIRDRAPHADRLVKVCTRSATMSVGDYAVAVELAPGTGTTLPIRIERKSKADLFGTIGAGRERFRREMERAADERLRLFLVAECNLLDCITDPPPHSELPGMIVVRTLESWAIRYGLQVWWCGARAGGEQVTYRLLEFGVKHFRGGSEKGERNGQVE